MAAQEVVYPRSTAQDDTVKTDNPHDEQQYLDLIHRILKDGEKKKNRTGTDTLSMFGTRMEFNMSNDSIPFLTTKRVYYKMIIKELIWFISGSTDSKVLEAQNVRIWRGNSSKEFLEKLNLPYREGDIGPGYGFQWRYWGADYKGCDADYSGQGIDQLQNLIDEIRTNPGNLRGVALSLKAMLLRSSFNSIGLERGST